MISWPILLLSGAAKRVDQACETIMQAVTKRMPESVCCTGVLVHVQKLLLELQYNYGARLLLLIEILRFVCLNVRKNSLSPFAQSFSHAKAQQWSDDILP